MKESDLDGTITYDEGPIASITTKIDPEDEETGLAREVMEEPRTTVSLRMTAILRIPLERLLIDLNVGEKQIRSDGSSVGHSTRGYHLCPKDDVREEGDILNKSSE